MRKSKKNEMRFLSREFNQLYDRFSSDLCNDRFDRIAEDFSTMQKFDQLYVRAEKMPVWPFNLAIFTKFAALVATLGIALLANYIIKYV